MPLREEFAIAGSFLFRWRSYFPLAPLTLVVSQMRVVSIRLDSPREPFCVLIAVFGLLVRAYVVGHAPSGTSGRNTRSQIGEQLNTTGAYSIVRHPLYLGNFFIWLGVALVPGSWWLVFSLTAVFWIYYERIMYAEEEFLRDEFKKSYLRWARRTPAFYPNPRLFRKPSLPFSVKTVLRREPSSWFGVMASFTLLELMGNWSAERRPTLDQPWTLVAAGGSLGYLVLRSLKRHTRWLNVEGR